MVIGPPAVVVAIVLATLGPTEHHQQHDVGEKLDVSEGRQATPTPSPAPAPVSTGSLYLTADQVASYARQAGFPSWAISTMVGYAARESNFCPTAVYPGHCGEPSYAYAGGPACGLWQLFRCPGPQALNPLVNAELAYVKFHAAGDSFSPWGG